MSDQQLRDALDLVAKLVVAAGRWIRARAFEHEAGGQLEVSSKSEPSDFVTEVDVAVERRLYSQLTRHFPSYGFMAEEGTSRMPDAEFIWVLDPLDGTRNFINAHAGYCVSLGLLRHGKAVLALVYDVVADELYTAIRGGGAYCNGLKLSVSVSSDPALCTVGVGFTPGARAHAAQVERYLRLLHGTAALRQSGSVARDLAYVARGSLDAFWQPEVSPWDVAAGMLLVEEAGGHVKLLHDGADWVTAQGLGVVGVSAAARDGVLDLLFPST